MSLKKKLAIFLTFNVLFASLLAASVGNSVSAAFTVYGDVSGDGRIMANDYALVRDFVLKRITRFPVEDIVVTPTPTITPIPMTPTPESSYDTKVLADAPVGYWPISPGFTIDKSGHGLNGTFTNNPSGTTMPNGDAATVFNGVDQYFTVADNDYLEITRKGILTIEAWLRPDVLEFPNSEGTGYVHWMGKGTSGQHAYASRIYSKTNTENRPNRISGYVFNLSGGLGAGSYFQDAVTEGTWIHYAFVINTVNTSSAYPTGYTKIYKSGILRDQDSLSDYNIIPGNGRLC